MAAKKRDPDQIVSDRARIAELAMQGMTDAQIGVKLREETGIVLSTRMINYDINKVREGWLKKQETSYTVLVNQELARLDSLEKAIWDAMRAAAGEKQERVIEEVSRRIRAAEDGDGDQYALMINRVTTAIKNVGINPAFFDKIMECQKERRKLLGLYPKDDKITHEHVIVKGYGSTPSGHLVSPDDWPAADIVDGEFEEQKRLPAHAES